MKRALAALFVWLIALSAIPARDVLFSGQIYVWPFLLGSCALAARFNPQCAIAIALGVGGAQLIEVGFHSPEIYQFAFYALLGFAAILFVDTIAALVASLAAMIYLGAASDVVALPWRPSMIWIEVIIVAGLSFGVLNGPSGGILAPMESRNSSRKLVRNIAVRLRKCVGV